MAFIGLFFGMIVFEIIVVGFFTTVGFILLIAAAVMKKNGKKHFMIPRVIGILCMVPLVISVGSFIYGLLTL